MKQLLVEYIPIKLSPQNLKECTSENNGKVIVTGVLQRAEAVNQNGRVYPKKILARESVNYDKNFIKEKRALGELDHPDSSTVNLNNVSHNIVEMYWEGNDLCGKIEILNTPSGKILKELLNGGITLGISSRGVGSVKEMQNEDTGNTTYEIQEDFELICFDFVSNPSTHGAFMTPVNESKDFNLKKTDKINKINNLITNIICDITMVK